MGYEITGQVLMSRNRKHTIMLHKSSHTFGIRDHSFLAMYTYIEYISPAINPADKYLHSVLINRLSTDKNFILVQVLSRKDSPSGLWDKNAQIKARWKCYNLFLILHTQTFLN